LWKKFSEGEKEEKEAATRYTSKTAGGEGRRSIRVPAEGNNAPVCISEKEEAVEQIKIDRECPLKENYQQDMREIIATDETTKRLAGPLNLGRGRKEEGSGQCRGSIRTKN